MKLEKEEYEANLNMKKRKNKVSFEVLGTNDDETEPTEPIDPTIEVDIDLDDLVWKANKKDKKKKN